MEERQITENGDLLLLTDDALDEQFLSNFIKAPTAGANCIFVGTTRDSFHDQTVTRLEYEAYSKVAIKTLGRLASEVRTLTQTGSLTQSPSPATSINLPRPATTNLAPSTSSIVRIALAHRLGSVAITESSIFIGVSSPHRREAFAACEWLLEAVKQRAEIWKKEWYEAGPKEPSVGPDGSTAAPVWKENFVPELR